MAGGGLDEELKRRLKLPAEVWEVSGGPGVGRPAPSPAQRPNSQLPDGGLLLLLDRWVLSGCSTRKGREGAQLSHCPTCHPLPCPTMRTAFSPPTAHPRPWPGLPPPNLTRPHSSWVPSCLPLRRPSSWTHWEWSNRAEGVLGRALRTSQRGPSTPAPTCPSPALAQWASPCQARPGLQGRLSSPGPYRPPPGSPSHFLEEREVRGGVEVRTS